jgi:hypothetical protein
MRNKRKRWEKERIKFGEEKESLAREMAKKRSPKYDTEKVWPEHRESWR